MLARPKAPWTPATCSSQRWRAASCIASAPPPSDEYRQYIEKDAALERRFQKIFIPEPSANESLAILRGLKERYEIHHKVDIADAALVAAVRLSTRYILR